MGGKTQTATTTNQSTTTPTNVAGLQSIFDKVQSAAATPYTPYGGQLTAGVNEQQNQGIAGINAGANVASPYYAQAQQYATQAGAPLSQAAISSYMNPYQQSVIEATQRNFAESNGQQQQQVKGNLALSGALGGSRQAVAQAETARQQKLAQDPVIAQMNADNYKQALAAAQGDRSAAGSAAGTLGQLGTGAQGAALQGAGAQIGAGTLQQTAEQAALDAQYKQYLQAQGFPYQQAQFLAQYGTPAALAQGSTTSGTGTQTTPGPNPFVQAAGLGLSAAGMFLKDGGRVGYADGGSPYNFVSEAPGFIPLNGQAPQVSMPQSSAPQMSMSGQGSATQADPWKSVTAGLGSMRGRFAGTPDYGQTSNVDIGGYSMPMFGSSPARNFAEGIAPMSHGGLVEAIHGIHKAIKHSRGGTVGGTPFAPFANGGEPRQYAEGGATFDDRFSAAFPAPEPQEEPFRLAGPEAMDAWRKDVDNPNPALVADASMPPVPVPRPTATSANPMQSAALPPQITGPDQEEEDSGSAMAFDATAPRNPMNLVPREASAQDQPPEQQFGKSLFGVNLSDKTRQAMVAAGLGIAASKSPFALTALGEGGQQGLKTYTEVGAAERAAANTKISQAQQQRRVDMEAQRLAQSAEQFAKNNSLAERRLKAEEKRNKTADERGKWTYLGPSDDGKGSVFMDATTGDTEVRPIKVAPKSGSNKPLPSPAVKSLTEAGSTYADFDRLVTTFKPEYAGKTIGVIGEAQNAIGRNVGAGYGEQAQWWQDYQMQKNEIRNRLFGSALTATEKAEFDKAAITPGMTKETVEANLGRQRLLAQRAARKLAQVYRKSGYSEEAIEAAVGVPLSTLEEPAVADKAKTDAAPPSPPKGIPPGSAYSPSRKQWKAPDGTIFNADGSKA